MDVVELRPMNAAESSAAGLEEADKAALHQQLQQQYQQIVAEQRKLRELVEKVKDEPLSVANVIIIVRSRRQAPPGSRLQQDACMVQPAGGGRLAADRTSTRYGRAVAACTTFSSKR